MSSKLTTRQRVSALHRVERYGGQLTRTEKVEVSNELGPAMARSLRQVAEAFSNLGMTAADAAHRSADLRSRLWDEQSLDGWQQASEEAAERRRLALAAKAIRAERRRANLKAAARDACELAFIAGLFAFVIFVVWFLFGLATMPG